MLNCKQASQLISQGLDRELSLRERFGLKLHLLICKYCKRFSQQLKQLYVAISSMGKQIEQDKHIRLPTKTKANILKSIKEQD